MKTTALQFQEATVYDNAYKLLDASLQACTIADGLYLEFGVADGCTLWHIARKVPLVFGFDWFWGLPEDWDSQNKKGVFSREGRAPRVPENARLVVGQFHESLPPFLLEHPEPVAFAHIDCDLYSSTKTILSLLTPRIQPGTILNFNEFGNYKDHHLHEQKAFEEFLEETGFSCECLGRTNSQYAPAAFRIIPGTQKHQFSADSLREQA